MTTLDICICGAGRTGHLYVALLKQKDGIRVSLLSRSASEVRSGLSPDGIQATLPDGKIIFGCPDVVSDDPSVVIPNADMVIIALPAHLRPAALNLIAPHISATKPVAVGAIPGSAGFDWLAAKTLPESAVIWGFRDVPYSCYDLVPGSSVVAGGMTKRLLLGFHERTPEAQRELLRKRIEHIFCQDVAVVDDFLELTLALGNPVMHLPALYALIGPYSRNTKAEFSERLYWWKDISELGAYFIDRCAGEQYEIIERARERLGLRLGSLRPLYPDLLHEFSDYIPDKSDLYSVLRTNSAFKGRVPLKRADSKDVYTIDTASRIFQEDTSFGMVLILEIGKRLGVEPFHHKEIGSWSQRFADPHLGTAASYIPGDWPGIQKQSFENIA